MLNEGIFIDKHGNAALLESMKKEEALFSNGDIEGSRVWHRITNAIEWMQMPENITGKNNVTCESFKS